MKTFYLGAHHPNWLSKAGVPLFISHRRLRGYKTLPKAIEHWALDSGGFSEISQFGKWTTTPEQYVQAVRRYDNEIGHLGWAAPQDWMCEPDMLSKTGLTIQDHQQRTVRNFLECSNSGETTTGKAPSCPSSKDGQSTTTCAAWTYTTPPASTSKPSPSSASAQSVDAKQQAKSE